MLRVNWDWSVYIYHWHVGYGYVARLSNNSYGEVGFEGGFVKTGEGFTSKSRFKLRGRQDSENVIKHKVKVDQSWCD